MYNVTDDICAVLGQHFLLKQAHTIDFGEESVVATKKVTTSAAVMSCIPAISIYIISEKKR
jgi:hypothetical protein